MREIRIEDAIAERISEFIQVFADVANEPDSTLESVANVVLIRGLDLMMVEFFRKLDYETLGKSLQRFGEKYPHSAEAIPSDLALSDSELVNKHVALSNRYPKPFFAFMFEILKWKQSAEAKERFRQLFKGTDLEQD